jgi:AcrR family transcriptional regulator
MARGPSRRGEILEAASEHFRAAGFDGTALSVIAHAAGVSKAAVSFHFESKEAMLVELVEPLLSELEAVLSAYPAPEWPDGVRQLTGEYFDVLVRHHAVAAWLDSDSSAQRRAGIGRRLGRSMEGLADAITGSNRDPGARVRAFAAVGGIWRPVRVLPIEALVAHREELLDAALGSYPALEPRLSHTA